VAEGTVRYSIIQFPILGAGSVRAAVATECAAEQDHFWEYHDALYEASGQQGSSVFNLDPLVGLAGDLGLDTDRFESCFTEGRPIDQIQEDSDAVTAMGVRSTPTIFINDVRYQGHRTFELMSARIEELAGK
jgi:protein-disulfide isomerase